MTEIQGKSIWFELARVRVIGRRVYVPYSMMLQRFYLLPFSFSGDGSVWTWGWGKISSVLFFTSLPLPDKRDAMLISDDKDIFEVF